MNTKYSVIIFDWDGTLINSIDWIVNCLQTAASQCDLPVPSEQDSRDIIGLSLTEALAAIFPGISTQAKADLINAYSQQFFSRQTSKQDLFDGVYAMLTNLQATGYHLTVATGKTRASLDKMMHATETENLFQHSRCADETASKPDPKMIFEIIEEFNVDSKRVLMVGDSVHDLQMAENAGIDTIAVSCGAHSATTLAAYNPLACLSRTPDLIDFLRGNK